MRGFSINLKGRIKNFPLPKNQPLIPLFEAIVNSIHAIEERRNRGDIFDGEIMIRIFRDGQLAMKGYGEIPNVESFSIIDNGIGFTELNMESFMESDSTYKEALGGKGVGRFSWLVAFEKATVESIYQDGSSFVKRSFVFSTAQSEIDDQLIDCDGTQNDNITTIRLLNYLRPYADNVPKKALTIALRIIEHCLVFFISKDCPRIILVDDDESYNLNNIFREKIQAEGNSVSLQVGDEEFTLLHVKAEEVSINGNKLYLCANNRLVEVKDLDKYITDLDRTIYEKNGFWYIGVLRGHYLDANVDMNRLSFSIPDNGMPDSMTITMDQILAASIIEVEKFLSPYLQPISESKLKHIQSYVASQAPQYRHLMKYMPKDIAQIKPNLTDEKLDDELHKIKRKFDNQVRTDNAKLLKDLNKGTISSEDYQKRFQEHIERVSTANSAVLAEYVAHRKVIIDLLESAIRKNNDSEFEVESYLHNLIYPMRTTSTDLPYDNHNLWLLDEKLSYCTYISSDIPFDNNPKEDRTDIMILDSPVAVSDEVNRGLEYETIVLFELKRPMRDDYTDVENPIKQLYKYVKKLKTGRVSDKDGRLITVGANTKYYLYAICDITPTLRSILDIEDFTQTPDKLGFYRYHTKFNAYIEVLSYNKIINDAKKRNQVLFDKLGL